MFDASGTLPMWMSFDHRVLDGATAARALAKMEEVLLDVIIKEINELNESAELRRVA
jgi:pyruvate/2-oxoglutarate dehydrogenase complex dihydrolipoamide acyltransferase (E2) component